jgi:hypothetical protein
MFCFSHSLLVVLLKFYSATGNRVRQLGLSDIYRSGTMEYKNL